MYSIPNESLDIEDTNLQNREFFKAAEFIIFMPKNMDLTLHAKFTDKIFKKNQGQNETRKYDGKDEKYQMGWYEAIGNNSMLMKKMLNSFTTTGTKKKFNVIVNCKDADKFAHHVLLDQYIGLGRFFFIEFLFIIRVVHGYTSQIYKIHIKKNLSLYRSKRMVSCSYYRERVLTPSPQQHTPKDGELGE